MQLKNSTTIIDITVRFSILVTMLAVPTSRKTMWSVNVIWILLPMIPFIPILFDLAPLAVVARHIQRNLRSNRRSTTHFELEGKQLRKSVISMLRTYVCWLLPIDLWGKTELLDNIIVDSKMGSIRCSFCFYCRKRTPNSNTFMNKPFASLWKFYSISIVQVLQSH